MLIWKKSQDAFLLKKNSCIPQAPVCVCVCVCVYM